MSWGDCPALFPPGCKIAVLHGDPAKPGADVFLRVPAGYTIPAHWHTSAERMVLVSGSLDVTYAGHPTARLETNDYAYGPAKLPHVAKCRSKTPCTLFIAFDRRWMHSRSRGTWARRPEDPHPHPLPPGAGSEQTLTPPSPADSGQRQTLTPTLSRQRREREKVSARPGKTIRSSR